MSKAKGILTALALLALFGWVGEMDMQAAQADRDHYCEMVRAGHWPDYAGTYRAECLPPNVAQR